MKSTQNQETIFYSLFETELGFTALVGREETVHDLLFGDNSMDALERRLTDKFDAQYVTRSFKALESDWFPECREKIQEYATGQPVDFSLISTLQQAKTTFQSEVLKVVTCIAHGETMTYAEVADAAGSPGAARAVGTVMSKNRIPLIIPCHRVIASGGKLGGYSAAQGVKMKEFLLAMEAEHSQIALTSR